MSHLHTVTLSLAGMCLQEAYIRGGRQRDQASLESTARERQEAGKEEGEAGGAEVRPHLSRPGRAGFSRTAGRQRIVFSLLHGPGHSSKPRPLRLLQKGFKALWWRQNGFAGVLSTASEDSNAPVSQHENEWSKSSGCITLSECCNLPDEVHKQGCQQG